MSALEIIPVVLTALVAFGMALKGKDARKPWYDAWWKSLCAAVAVGFLAIMFRLLPPTVALTAAGCGAFFGLCWNSPSKQDS